MLELDFQSDPSDIRDPDTHLKDTNAEETATITNHQKRRYMVSLREYCKILYLKPKMKIWIQGKKVRTLLIRKSLRRSQEDTYKPSWTPNKIPITFGFASTRFDDYGAMLYHYNRLILAYEKLGCQKQTNDFGNDVIAVVEANALEVINNKQDFIRDAKYSTLMDNISKKLRDYWNVKKGNAVDMEDTLKNNDKPFGNWVQCDNCNKWRRLRNGVQAEDLPLKWYCRNNEDPQYNRCDIEEEEETEDVEEEKRRKYRKMKMNQQRLQREKSGTQSRQSLVNNLNRSQTVNEGMDQVENILAGEDVMDISTAVTPSPSSCRNEASRMETPAKRLKMGTVGINQITLTSNNIPQENEQVMMLDNFAETIAKELVRTCNKEETEKKRRVGMTKKPTEVMQKVDESNRKLEEANKKANTEREQANTEREQANTEREQAYRKLEDANRKANTEREQANTEKEQANRKLEDANRKVEEAGRKIEESLKREEISQQKANTEREQANRKLEDANRKVEEAGRKIEESLRREEISQKKVAMAGRHLQEAAQKANTEREQANRKLEDANRKVEEAGRKIEESLRREEISQQKVAMAGRHLQEAAQKANTEREQANRMLEDANRKVEEAGRKIEESLRREEISQQKVAMAGRHLQEAAQKLLS
ncbi:MORC family CW-type zinc finger protein 3-like isoform X2 [Mizuhopecten yessoensis]|uniref:MORC family CW-type zinc finger protein 3-like isoform X2 n=1 Tax=Mizuhopecten yessoensis TaxID=6573 RepID=UPI000B45ED13|nr:MORC family CW-type zinc finger protein 3-like isoform X2 [Mizuhopecten yessoensis]